MGREAVPVWWKELNESEQCRSNRGRRKKVKYMRVKMGPWMLVLTISKHKFIHPFNPFNQTENYDSILSTKH
jgi:hypothetical protein